MREIKLRAVREGRKLKDLITELLETGMSSREPKLEKAQIQKDESGFPIIVNAKTPEVHSITPDRISEILLDQEDSRYRNSA